MGSGGRISRSLAEAKRITESSDRAPSSPTFANPFLDISMARLRQARRVHATCTMTLGDVLPSLCIPEPRRMTDKSLKNFAPRSCYVKIDYREHTRKAAEIKVHVFRNTYNRI